jgi:hypothetical protein
MGSRRGERDRPGRHLPRAATGRLTPWSLVLALALSLTTLTAGGQLLRADPASAQPEALDATAAFQRFEWLELAEDEDALRSAVIDPAGRFAYFATASSPSRVLKMDLETFTRVGAIELPDGPLRTAVIDPAGRYAYFGGRSRVVKIDLRSFTRVDALPIPDVSSAVMDPPRVTTLGSTHPAP